MTTFTGSCVVHRTQTVAGQFFQQRLVFLPREKHALNVGFQDDIQIGEWHENPKPQWISVLSGRWFVETMDGQRVEMGPGDISFGADQGTQADAEGRKGHLSGTVGNEPCTMVIIQFDQTPEEV